ncbi:conserved hypothetical protein [Brevundimonas subvibrioides ATCC 15264]|uniref:Uncharacterized protein n=2 Tax=Brevundimonas subvibrioides TaxID=74313 RepID=D9QF16_BRESC|nr:conserved hypothetical protein [Brevundimonas subvibrioides ATCC 15264]
MDRSRSGTDGDSDVAMFEFGRDLRKLFGEARDSDDLGWLELIGVELLAVEARALTTDGGRVSCRQPARTWLRASALWREHARRTGQRDSIAKALATADDAARASTADDDLARAGLARASALLTSFDLFGDRDALDEAASAARETTPRRLAVLATSAGVHARIRARQARLSETTADRLDAAALMDAALHAITKHNPVEADDLRLDNAALALEGGIVQRDPRLLDQAGRDLKALVEASSADTRPLTRARALALCGAGLSALAAMADDAGAVEAGHAMFDAAADQFTPDHSPMDWVAIQVARAIDPASPIEPLIRAEALTGGHGTLLGGLARDLLVAREIERALDTGDLMALTRIETRVRRRLAERVGPPSAVEWAVDQLGMARVMIARGQLMDSAPDQAAFVLSEAAEAARDHGVPVLADRARALMLGLSLRV